MSGIEGNNMKKKPIEVKTKPKSLTAFEAVTVLADALKDIELCVENHGATLLTDKILFDLNPDLGFFNMHLKICFTNFHVLGSDFYVSSQDLT